MAELAVFANNLFGKKVTGSPKSWQKLQFNLTRAGITVPVEAYLSLMIFVSLLAFIIPALATFFTLAYLSRSFSPIIPVLSIGFGMVGAITSFAVLNGYPSITGSKSKKGIEESLPYTLSFMGILSGAGVPPKRIFSALAKMEQTHLIVLGGQAKTVFRDMELFGSDVATAMREAAQRKISPLLSSVFEGIISTTYSGGDLTGYLEAEARSLMRLRRGIIKEFLDSLVMISEMYMALMVAFPLILIVMLVVMTSIGGGDILGSSPQDVIPLMIYAMVPLVGTVLIIWLDSAMPKG